MSAPEGKGCPEKASRDLLRLALDSAGVGICRCTLDGNILEIDPAALRILELQEFEPRELVGRNVTELFSHPANRGQDWFHRMIDRYGPGPDRGHWFHTPRGRLKWILHDSLRFEDETTGQKRIQIMIRDITERKEAEQRLQEIRSELEERARQRAAGLEEANLALRRAENRFQRFAASVSDVIYRFDQSTGTYEFVSPSFERQTGYSVQELMEDPQVVVRNAMHPEGVQVVERRIQEHIRQGPQHGPLTVEYQLRRKDGRVIWVSEAIDFEFGSDGSVTALNSVVRDITERKESEAERDRLIRELEMRNQELDRYTYSVSHDLKAPLFTINGFLALLAEDVRQGRKDRIEEHLRRISGASDRMADLLDDLLQLSRVGRIMNPPEQVDLGVLAHEARDLLSGLLTARGVKVEIPGDLPVVRVDRTRLLMVLQNLIQNAVKFMGDQREPRVVMGGRRNGEEWILWVRDNGIGLEEADSKMIFQAFQRLSAESEGTGIGLTLVERIIGVHGGRVWVESPGPGQGSTFYFTLPA